MARVTRRQALTAAGATGVLLADLARVRGQVPGAGADAVPSKEVARLIELLRDPNPAVRKQAAVALGEINKAIRASLQKALTDADADVRGAVAAALDAKPATPAGTPALRCTGCGGKGETKTNCLLCNGAGLPKCAACAGTGRNPFNKAQMCFGCLGKGANPCASCKSVGYFVTPCTRCNRSGIEPGTGPR